MTTSIRRFLILFLFIAASAWPQASSSTVGGTVRDTSHAVIPSAKVTLTNMQTNVARATKTDEAGIYTFPGVILGTYRIVVEAPGFANFQGGVTVDAQHDVSVDATLAPGQVATTVSVQDVTPLVTTDSGSVSQILENDRINSLPINGRNYQSLLATVPDMGADQSGHEVEFGTRWNSGLTLFDGGVHSETFQAWDFLQPPGLDDIAEVNVQVANASAKFSTPFAILLSSKNGTNQFHGDLFETNRNSGYGVARQRQTPSNKPPYLNNNEYGASAGGPVVIPKVYNGRNRTFWFISWEGQRSLQSSSSYYTVPTEAMRNGDFSDLVNGLGQQTNIYNPFTTNPTTYQRSQFAYNGVPNTINPALESPTAKYLFSVTALPTLPQVNPTIGPNWLGNVPSNNVRGNSASLRLDQTISQKDSIWGRLETDNYTRYYPNGGLPALDGVANWDRQFAPQKALEVTWVHTFSPTMTSEFLVTGSYQHYERGIGDGTTNYTALLGLPNAFNSDDWPTIDTPYGNYYSENGYWHQFTSYINAQENLTKMVGRHELQFGFQTLQEFINVQTTGDFNNADFNSDATSLYDPTSTAQSPQALPLTGNAEANLYLGVGDYASHFQRRPVRYRRRDYSPYFQDDWRVNSRLTVNLGLRWDLRAPVYDAGGTNIGFDLQNMAFVTSLTPSQMIQKGLTLPSIIQDMEADGATFETNKQAGLPASLVNFNPKEFGPRFGVAYQILKGRHPLVVRGGYRISYWAQRLDQYESAQSSTGPVFGPFQYSLTNAALSPNGLPNYGLISVPTCIAGAGAANCININNPVGLTPGATNFSFQGLTPNSSDGRLMDWNFTLEKDVPGNMLASVSYVGSYASRIQTLVDFNDSPNSYIWYVTTGQPLPTGVNANTATRVYNSTPYGYINFYEPIGFSHSNRYTFEIQRRFHQGLALQAFYVLGRTLLVNQETNYNYVNVQTVNAYLPGTVPTNAAARLKFLDYTLDNQEPLQSMNWNFVYDLPFGKGKMFAGNAHGVLDKIIGGWQLSGLGSWRSSWWSLPTSYYPNGTPIQTYGYKYPIKDCTSGVCNPGYLWWNGYIPPNQINAHNAAGQCSGICGVPANYSTSGNYLVPYGSTALPPNAPAGTNVSSYWATNTVWIPLKNGTIQRTTYSNNMPPWANQYMRGPIQWFQDASLRKWFSVHEKVRLRFSFDFFNVLNNPNNPIGVGGNGLLDTNNSGSAARVAQLELRLEW